MKLLFMTFFFTLSSAFSSEKYTEHYGCISKSEGLVAGLELEQTKSTGAVAAYFNGEWLPQYTVKKSGQDQLKFWHPHPVPGYIATVYLCEFVGTSASTYSW